MSLIITNDESTDTIEDEIRSDLEITLAELHNEKADYFSDTSHGLGAATSEMEKSKRLLYLFQRDLMPGVQGKVLESKDLRENALISPKSKSMKLIAWISLLTLDVGMLFYVFLFAIEQEEHRQRAWSQSFALWLVMEILFISSITVVVMNVIVPTFLVRDLEKVRMKLMESLANYHQQSEASKLKYSENGNKSTHFNAADYLFVSVRLAKLFPDLKVAKVISQFQTPWPRQSYRNRHHIDSDVTKSYSRRYDALSRSAMLVAVFFFGSFVQMPASIQDITLQLVSAVVVGYTTLLHLQLLHIYPILVVIPTILFIAIVYIMTKRGVDMEKIKVHAILRRGKAQNEVVAHSIPSTADDKEVSDVIHMEDGQDYDMESSVDVNVFATDSVGDSKVTIPPITEHKTRRQSVQIGLALAKQAQTLLTVEEKPSQQDVQSFQNSTNSSHDVDTELSFGLSKSDSKSIHNQVFGMETKLKEESKDDMNSNAKVVDSDDSEDIEEYALSSDSESTGHIITSSPQSSHLQRKAISTSSHDQTRSSCNNEEEWDFSSFSSESISLSSSSTSSH